MKALLITLLLLVLPMLTVSADNGSGGMQSPFDFGTGARELSLGGSNLAGASAAVSPFWNSSNLARAERITLYGFHTNLFESDVAYQYFGFVIPTLDFGSFGVGVFRLGVSDIEKRDAGNVALGTFDDNRMALYMAYGRELSGYDVGLALMVEHHSIDNYKATSSPGLTLSVTRQWQTGSALFDQFSITANARNILSPGMELADENVQFPFKFDGGLNFHLRPNKDWNHRANLSARLDKSEQEPTNFSTGLEIEISEMLFLRGGLRDGNYSAGAGIAYSNFVFDYALVGRDLGTLHMFSLTSEFGSTIEDRRFARQTQNEQEFNSKMAQNLLDQNRTMYKSLMTDAKQYYNDNDYRSAVRLLDRAVFIARGALVDTLESTKLLTRARLMLETEQKQEQLAAWLDSAQVNYATGNYLAVRYFAGLALEIDENSTLAISLIKQAESNFESIQAQDSIIGINLAQIDSLMSYGEIEKSITIAYYLNELAPDKPEVMAAYRRVEFARYQQLAYEASSNTDYKQALVYVDSAATIFPGHLWCNEYKGKIAKLTKASIYKPTPQLASRPSLSAEVERQISQLYAEAKSVFEKGELQAAVQAWEEVERLSPNYQSVRKYLVNAYKFIGVELYGLDRLEEALTIWEKAARIAPENKEIQGYLDRTRGEIKKIGELSYEE